MKPVTRIVARSFLLSILAFTLLAVSWSLVPGAATLLREAGLATDGIRPMLAAAWSAAASLLSATVVVAGNLLEATPAVLRSFGPAGARALILGWVLMAAAIVLVVGRDLFSSRWASEGN